MKKPDEHNVFDWLKITEWFLWLLFAAGAGQLIWFAYNNPDRLNGIQLLPYPMVKVSICCLAIALIYIFFLALAAILYRPFKDDRKEEELPGVTVIVPAYNEGKHVSDTLSSILASDYPAEKLEIIAVNDGSQDDTWEWITYSANRANGRIRTINLPRNGGKKHALYTGIKAATFDFIVTVDSDSLVERRAVRNIIAPFQDERVGAVAGNIRGKKDARNFFVLMMDVAMTYSCEFMRPLQSAFGTVFCTPGALSAYRKSAVMPLLDEWMHQTFMGVPSTIGEDRAIATLLLRSGYYNVHQQNAVVETCLPDTYWKLCRMLIRWMRSDVRENILMSRFLLRNLISKKFRGVMMLFHWLILSGGMILPVLYLPGLVVLIIFALDQMIFLPLPLISSTAWSLVPAVIYGRIRKPRKMVWAFIFGVFAQIGLIWIYLYAFCTVRNSKWMTREKRKERQRPAVGALLKKAPRR